MSKRIITLAVLTCLSLNAGAQWYLFPGKESNVPKENTVPEESEQQETAQPAMEPTYTFEQPETISVALLLPLDASSSPNANFFEMYCGALLAARDIGTRGTPVTINVHDTSSEAADLGRIMEENEIILGPVKAEMISKALELLPYGKFIVSPLEPKADRFVDSCRVIQSPPSWMAQYDELARWIAADRRSSAGRLYVVRDRNSPDSHGDYLIARLREEGVAFETIPSISRDKVAEGENGYVVASGRDDFIATAIRELGLAGNKCDPTLYTTSKARNLPIDGKLLYQLNTRMTANYHIDYCDPRVREFVLAYRALFNTEPGSFAFQGYDMLYYLARACAEYGIHWENKIAEYPLSGLQSDFCFTDEGTAGFRNTAVRRVIYSRATMSTSLQ